jgi:hypothetical protein
MKSVSPSAVIFGPMLAISAEGFLVEAGLRLLGTNSAGYLLAGGLAMLGTLGYKLLRLLMVYGPDTINVYLRGVDWLRGSGVAVGSNWAPLLAASAAYFLGGGAAALAGLAAGREHGVIRGGGGNAALKPAPAASKSARSHSAAALMAHIVFVAGVLAAGRSIPAAALAAAAVFYGYITALNYPRASGLLRRGGVWAGVLVASLAAGVVLGSVSAGLYMALRAFLVTISFAAIGEELLNPAIRSGLERRLGTVFFETLEYAFSSLPGIIAALPSGRDFARRPLASLGATVARAPFLLDAGRRRRVFIITGPHGSGKTGGICASGLWENRRRAGFDLVNISNGSRVPLCRRGPGGEVRAGEYRFFDEGLVAGGAALSEAGVTGADAVFVDEVGFLELEGGGWSGQLERMLSRCGPPLVVSVRDYLIGKVQERWGINPDAVWKSGETTVEAAYSDLCPHIGPGTKEADSPKL